MCGSCFNTRHSINANCPSCLGEPDLAAWNRLGLDTPPRAELMAALAVRVGWPMMGGNSTSTRFRRREERRAVPYLKPEAEAGPSPESLA